MLEIDCIVDRGGGNENDGIRRSEQEKYILRDVF